MLKWHHVGLISLRSWFESRSRYQFSFQSRSAVDQRTVNPCVVGSIPTSGAISESLSVKCLTSSLTTKVLTTYSGSSMCYGDTRAEEQYMPRDREQEFY